MAVPKRKTTPSRRNMRRSHDALKGVNVVFDQNSGEAKLPHHVCKGGYYNGKLVKAPKNNDTAENHEHKHDENCNHDHSANHKEASNPSEATKA